MGRMKKERFSKSKAEEELPTSRSPEEENEEPMENVVQQVVKPFTRNQKIKDLSSKVEKHKKVKNTGLSVVKREVKEKLKVHLQLSSNTKLVNKTKILSKRVKQDNKKTENNKSKVLVENDSVNTTDEDQINEESEKSISPASNGNENLLPTETDENQNESKDAEENDETSIKVAKQLKKKAKRAPKRLLVKEKLSSTKMARKSLPKRIVSPISQFNMNENENLICRICHQLLKNLKFYSGTIENEDKEKDDSVSVSQNDKNSSTIENENKEKDDSVSVSQNDENREVLKEEAKSHYKLTSFSIFCKYGHICPFESVLLSEKEDILISGCLQPVGKSFAPLKKEVPTNLGPIVDWWVIEHNAKEAIVCSTKNEDFILLRPSKIYAPFMKSTNLSIFIAKKIIEYLIISPTAVYQDLLRKLESTPMLKEEPRFSEDMLLQRIPFIVSQLIMFDQTARPHEPLLLIAPCIRRLIKLAGINLNDIKLPKENPQRNEQINAHREKLMLNVTNKKRRETQEALAELANNPFLLEENFARLSGRRCDACENCQRPACEVCFTCKLREPDRCILRRCILQEIEAANEEDSSTSGSLAMLSSAKVKLSLTAYADALGKFSCYASSFSWLGEPVEHEEDGSMYYKSMLLNGEEICEGDYVLAGEAVLRIAYLWRDETGTARMHAAHLWRARDSPLGSLGEHRELLHTAKCCELPVTCVLAKLPVTEMRTNENWDKSMWSETTAEGYYCIRSFDPVTGRFEDLPLEDVNSQARQIAPHRFCANCARAEIEARHNTPYPYEPLGDFEDITRFGVVKYRGEEYRVGSCVYLKPKTLYFKYPMSHNYVKTRSGRIRYIDEQKYPEYYRKIKEEESKKSDDSMLEINTPFDVGYITEIFIRSDKLFVKVKKMYRPENTHKRETVIRQSDYNMLFWSDEECSVLFSYVVGKCFLSHTKNLKEEVTEWTLKGPDRFYFSQMYENREFYNVDKKEYKCKTEVYDIPKVYSTSSLKTLNIFAGCGGLSLGLHQAGVANICWAVEPDAAAAMTFKLNNMFTTVFNEDCNDVLRSFVGGAKTYHKQSLPMRGEVDLLCASLSNEFVTDVTTFTNSKFATFLSYCEVYRPTYLILETDEILTKKNIALKLTLACLLSIGYQVSFDVLQVGSFGVPLNKKKLVILGAAPGRKLPNSPKPLHVFPKMYCPSGVVIDNKKYVQNHESMGAAPCRVVTIRDALADLPNITVENCIEVTNYSGQITSQYQKMMRLHMPEATVLNHICKNMGPLVQARISQIPLAAGSDWRNLPNIEMTLSDGNTTKKLIYKYDDKEAGKNSLDRTRGVCDCCVGKKCNVRDRQENCLIPWHLVHSAKQNCHWSGLYSRLQWDGFFNGTITNPEPLSEESPVIHPNQHRVVSVRECARVLGFPDNFLFPHEIEILDKYRIIGQATSPRLAFALGCEIARSIAHESL